MGYILVEVNPDFYGKGKDLVQEFSVDEKGLRITALECAINGEDHTHLTKEDIDKMSIEDVIKMLGEYDMYVKKG